MGALKKRFGGKKAKRQGPPLENTTLEALRNLKEQLKSEPGKDHSSEFSAQVKEFFKNLLKLKNNLTYEEFLDEIAKRRYTKEAKKEMTDFISGLAKMEYRSGGIQKKQLESLIASFEKLVIDATSDSARPYPPKKSQKKQPWQKQPNQAKPAAKAKPLSQNLNQNSGPVGEEQEQQKKKGLFSFLQHKETSQEKSKQLLVEPPSPTSPTSQTSPNSTTSLTPPTPTTSTTSTTHTINAEEELKGILSSDLKAPKKSPATKKQKAIKKPETIEKAVEPKPEETERLSDIYKLFNNAYDSIKKGELKEAKNIQSDIKALHSKLDKETRSDFKDELEHLDKEIIFFQKQQAEKTKKEQQKQQQKQQEQPSSPVVKRFGLFKTRQPEIVDLPPPPPPSDEDFQAGYSQDKTSSEPEKSVHDIEVPDIPDIIEKPKKKDKLKSDKIDVMKHTIKKKSPLDKPTAIGCEQAAQAMPEDAKELEEAKGPEWAHELDKSPELEEVPELKIDDLIEEAEPKKPGRKKKPGAEKAPSKELPPPPPPPPLIPSLLGKDDENLISDDMPSLPELDFAPNPLMDLDREVVHEKPDLGDHIEAASDSISSRFLDEEDTHKTFAHQEIKGILDQESPVAAKGLEASPKSSKQAELGRSPEEIRRNDKKTLTNISNYLKQMKTRLAAKDIASAELLWAEITEAKTELSPGLGNRLDQIIMEIALDLDMLRNEQASLPKQEGISVDTFSKPVIKDHNKMIMDIVKGMPGFSQPENQDAASPAASPAIQEQDVRHEAKLQPAKTALSQKAARMPSEKKLEPIKKEPRLSKKQLEEQKQKNILYELNESIALTKRSIGESRLEEAKAAYEKALKLKKRVKLEEAEKNRLKYELMDLNVMLRMAEIEMAGQQQPMILR